MPSIVFLRLMTYSFYYEYILRSVLDSLELLTWSQAWSKVWGELSRSVAWWIRTVYNAPSVHIRIGLLQTEIKDRERRTKRESLPRGFLSLSFFPYSHETRRIAPYGIPVVWDLSPISRVSISCKQYNLLPREPKAEDGAADLQTGDQVSVCETGDRRFCWRDVFENQKPPLALCSSSILTIFIPRVSHEILGFCWRGFVKTR